MKSRLVVLLALLALVSGLLFSSVAVRNAHAAPTAGTYTGTIDGAAYKIDIPASWNGTLVLYSHGYVAPGSPNLAQDVGDPVTGAWLLAHGYALAGSSYSTTGWALQQAFHDQIALLDYFDQTFGQPSRTIAWGHSLGGIITAGLVQLDPGRFDAALPMCGVVAGGVGTWNVALDAEFVFRTLLAPTSSLQVVDITHPGANLGLAEQILSAAQATPQGRARLALVAAMGDGPGWFTPGSPEPAPDDYAAQEQNQFLWDQQVDFPFLFALRAELEARAGGNPSWNTGIDYRVQLERSIDNREVEVLYKQAGLDLSADLATLASAPRISADPGAVSYLDRYIVFNGNLNNIPVLTMHTTGDGLVITEDERAYADTVRAAGNNSLLQEVFVHRAGHCAFTPAETVTAFQTLIQRLDTGHWGNITHPEVMDAEAAALGSSFNTFPPAFIQYEPAPFPRPFNASDET
ncbi:MAG TPA: prolyl oligopeptidase family serine peptidase [Ktedonobacterales bacterium]